MTRCATRGWTASTPTTGDRDELEACLTGPGRPGLGDEAPDVGRRREGRHPQGERRVPRRPRRRRPRLVAGGADLTGNTGTQLKGHGVQSRRATRAAARSTSASASTPWAPSMIGMALHGGVLPVGGTFFVFSDYMRRRRSASPRCHGPRSSTSCTHDSVGVGEDGPTHQPVEHLAVAAGHARASA